MISKLGRKRISIVVSKRKVTPPVVTETAVAGRGNTPGVVNVDDLGLVAVHAKEVYHEIEPGKFKKEGDLDGIYKWNNDKQAMELVETLLPLRVDKNSATMENVTPVTPVEIIAL